MDTKQKIIVSARKLFSLKGYDGTSVRDISRDANVNVAAINYHFSGKRQLLLELLKNDRVIFLDSIKELFNNKEQLTEFIEGLFDHFCEKPEIASTHYRSSMASDECGRDMVEGYSEFRGTLINLLSEKIKNELTCEVSDGKVLWVSNIILNQIIFDATSLSIPAIREGKMDWMTPIDQRRLRIKNLSYILINALNTNQVDVLS